MLRREVFLGTLFIFFLSVSSLLLAQENNEFSGPQIEETAGTLVQGDMPQEPVVEEKATEWIWGEVVSVDPANKDLVVKHLNYESYEEIQTPLKIDETTMFEDVADLSQIKAGYHVTADYKVKNGLNMAELIVVDKQFSEGAPLENSAADEPTPAPLSP